MAASDGFQIASYIFQVGGLVLTGVGVSQTFRGWRTDDDKFVRPIFALLARPIESAGRHVAALWRRIFQRRRTITGHMSATLPSLESALSLRAVMKFPGLPADIETEAALATLEDRLNRVHRLAQDVEHRLTQEINNRAQVLAESRAETAEQVDLLRQATRQVALDGLRLEAVGLFVVALGLASSAVGQAV